MLRECLVTRLKGGISADSEYFDALQVKFEPSVYTSGKFDFISSGEIIFGGIGCKVKILSNGTITSGTTTGLTEYVITDTLPTTASVIPNDNTKDCEFIVIGLNKVSVLGCQPGGFYMKNPAKIEYCSNLGIYGNNLLINFAPYKDEEIVDCSPYYANFSHKNDVTTIRRSASDAYDKAKCSTLSIKDYENLTAIDVYLAVDYGDVAELSNLTKLTLLRVRRPNVYGDIASLGKLTVCNEFNFNQSSIGGTIEDFVAAQYDNGRTSASNVKVYSSIITYLDNGIPKIIGISGKYISWTSKTDITVTSI